MRNSCPNEPWELASQPVGGLNTRESRLSEVVMSIVIGIPHSKNKYKETPKKQPKRERGDKKEEK